MLDFRLYTIIDSKYINNPLPLAEITTQLCQGGVTIIQLRDKNPNSGIILQNSLVIRDVTWKFNIPFIVNDRPDIALASKADGVHLGGNDLPIPFARKILPHAIIGASVNTVENAIAAEKDGADYLGVGCLFQSNTKTKPLIPVEIISKIKAKVNIPVVAIGGINLENLDIPISAGADGICVAHDILSRPDIKERTKKFISSLPQKKF